MQHASLLAAAPHLSAKWRRQYIDRLTAWFADHQRDLPWRRTRDPYAIWLSESMLQQTQVATVIDYYRRFLERFPTVRSLAEADEESVLAQWAGLGYYRRARQLHAAARRVVAAHGEVFPDDVEALMELPGVGRYTAGAIASIAFDKPAPIVEANTERLFARLLCLRESPRTADAKALLWQFADWQLSSGTVRGPRTINQAAMELGSLICKPRAPLCPACPLISLCPTAQLSLQETIPLPQRKKEFTALHHVALVIAHHDRWLVRMNEPGEWWTGLWDFPRVDVTNLELRQPARSALPIDDGVRERIAAAAERDLGLQTQLTEPLFAWSHGVTRYRIKLDCIAATGARVNGAPAAMNPSIARAAGPGQATVPVGWLWSTRDELDRLPLTASARKILDRLAAG